MSVINAPAGSGKTRVLTEIARAWTTAGLGPVIGITASQSARNTLAVGVPASYNAAQFLGHLPGRRGARGPIPIPSGTLLLVDEASTMPGPDLADLITYTEARNSKIILAGDTSQLQAVENGGGMSLLAESLGYAMLAEPVRFRASWEQQASLRLRDGDTTMLAEYDQHARFTGGTPRADDGRRRSRLCRPVHCRHRHAPDGRQPRAAPRTVPPHPRRPHHPRPRLQRPSSPHRGWRPGQHRRSDHLHRNDHATEAGEPGRTLANGDLLRIESITPAGLIVRRALDADPRTGQRRWTSRPFTYASYRDAELGYAVTDHTAQGRTVHTGLAVITGTEDRQHAYVALTRGTDHKHAYVVTTSPKQADPVPGPRLAP